MELLDSAMTALSAGQLFTACATITLLVAHLISPLARSVTTRWALGALIVWPVGALLWSWPFQSMSFRTLPWPGNQGTGVAAGGLAALLIWTVWYCRKRPVSNKRLCTLIMMASGLWWGLDQWRSELSSPLPDTLPALTLESLDGHSVTPTDDTSPRYLLLWRSDCPPCRQWLERLAGRPADHRPALALINQGEPLLGVIRYLDQHPDQQLELENTALLLDPRQRLLALTGSQRLPVLLHVGPDRALTRVDDLSTLFAAQTP